MAHPETNLDRFCIAKGQWSEDTFGKNDEQRGPNASTICEHIRKELEEVLVDPRDLTEWVDIILLAMDGYHRYGGRSIHIDLEKKQAVNYMRKWPDPAQRKPGEITEHIKEPGRKF